jgi:tetratricopeptide (TPR) repeat protein
MKKNMNDIVKYMKDNYKDLAKTYLPVLAVAAAGAFVISSWNNTPAPKNVYEVKLEEVVQAGEKKVTLNESELKTIVDEDSVGKIVKVNNKQYKIVSSVPSEAKSYLEAGNKFLRSASSEDAREAYNNDHGLSPARTFSRLGNNLGITDSDNVIEKAIDSYQAAIDLDDKYTDAYLGLATAYFSKGSFNDSIKTLNKAIKIDSKRADLYFQRGFVKLTFAPLANPFQRTRYFQRAGNDFEQALKIDPNYEDALKHLVIVKQALGEKVELIEVVDKSLEDKLDAEFEKGFAEVIEKDEQQLEETVKEIEPEPKKVIVVKKEKVVEEDFEDQEEFDDQYACQTDADCSENEFCDDEYCEEIQDPNSKEYDAGYDEGYQDGVDDAVLDSKIPFK